MTSPHRSRRGVVAPLLRTAAAALLLPILARGAAAQDPDSTRVVPPPDSVAPGVTVVPLDSGTVVDTVYTVHPDSVFRPLPGLTAGAPARRESGVTVWDAEALLGTSALTLRELLTEEPDLLPLRYGDYGAPEAVVGPGMAGGRVRVLVDGFEVLPIEGGTPDLSQVSLAGIGEVRVERAAGELRIHLTSLEPDDPRPLSRVEAGTGDLDTNLFRGTFLHPRALGGTLALSLERNDTEGRGGNEPGSRQAVWFRYALHRGDDLALSFDLRTRGNEVELDSIPPAVNRSAWAVRGRWRAAPSTVLEAYTGSTSLSSDDDGLTPVEGTVRQHGLRLSWDRAFGARAVPEPAPPPVVVAAPPDTVPAAPDTAAVPPDTVPAFPDTAAAPAAVEAVDTTAAPPSPDTAATAATTAPPGGLSGRLWARAEGRLFSGTDLPARRLEVQGGLDLDGVGGFAADYRDDSWSDPVREVGASTVGLRAWTAPLFGVSFFGGWDSGVRGAGIESRRVAIPEPDTTQAEPPPDTLPAFHLSDRTALRAGARVALGPLDVTGAWHRIETDSLLPLEILGTRQGVATPGDEATGYEVSGRLGLPVLVEGLALVGSLMEWDTEGPYRPRRRYTGGLDFHDVYKNGNLELWASFQVEGRDDMLLPWVQGTGEDATFVRVPFQQSWDFWLQVRVLTVRIFIRSENVTLRRSNQDFPGRLLPQTRSVYGVRWTLWN